MRRLKQLTILCLVMLMVITSLPLNALADDKESEVLKTSQTEIIKNEVSEENETELISVGSSQESEEIIEAQPVEGDIEKPVEDKIEADKEDKTETDKEDKEEDKVETDKEDKEEDKAETDEEDKEEDKAETDEENKEEDKGKDPNNKIDGEDEVKDDILANDDAKKTESIIAKLFLRFIDNGDRVNSLLMDKSDVRGEKGLLIVKVVDRDEPLKGLRGVKIRVMSKENPTENTFEIKTNTSGIAYTWMPKGKYYIKQINEIRGYIKFQGEIEINTTSLEFAKLVNITNISEDKTERNYSYKFTAKDAETNEGIEGMKVKIFQKNKPSVYVVKTTDSNGEVTFRYLEENNTMIKGFEYDVDYTVTLEEAPLAYGNKAGILEKISEQSNGGEKCIETIRFTNKDFEELSGNLVLKKKKKRAFIIHNVQELVAGDGLSNPNIPVKGSKFVILDENKKIITDPPLTTNGMGECSIDLYEGHKYYVDQVDIPPNTQNAYYVANDDIKEVYFNDEIEEVRFKNRRITRLDENIKFNFFKEDVDQKEGVNFQIRSNSEPSKIVQRFTINDFDHWTGAKYISLPRRDKDTNKETSYQIEQVNNSGKITNVFMNSPEAVVYSGYWDSKRHPMFILKRKIHLDVPGDGSNYTVITKVVSTDDYALTTNYAYESSLTSSQTGKVTGIEDLKYATYKRDRKVNDKLYYNNIGGAYRFEDYNLYRFRKEKKSWFEAEHRGSLKRKYRDGELHKVLNEAVAKMKHIDYKNKNEAIGTVGPMYLSAPIPEKPIIERKPNLTITKVDEVDHNVKLEGALFTLYNEDESVIVDFKITDEEGKAVFKELEDGIYYLVETQAPDGYKSDSKIRVEVKGGYVISNEFISIDEENVPIVGKGNIVKSATGSFRKNKSGEGNVVVNGQYIPANENTNMVDPQNSIYFEGEIKLTDNAKAGDVIKVKIDDNWKLGTIEYPVYTFNTLKTEAGQIFATGKYNIDTNEVEYTLTKLAERLYNKTCRIHYSSLLPKGTIDNYAGGVQANKRNPITISIGNLETPKNGKNTVDFTSYFFTNYQNWDEKLDQEMTPNYFFRTYFSQMLNKKTLRIVSYINMGYEQPPLGNTAFRLYTRGPGQNTDSFSNLDASSVRIYRVPNHLKSRYITRTYGWIDEGTQLPGVTEVSRYDIGIYKGSKYIEANDDSTAPLETLTIDFKPRHFANNEAYIVLNTMDLNAYNPKQDPKSFLYSIWGVAKDGARGYSLTTVSGGGGSAGEPATKNSKLTLTNYQAGEIYFKKVDLKNKENGLKDAKFKLMKKEGSIWVVVDKYKEVFSDEDGQFEFVGLARGEYKVVETAAPSGYYDSDPTKSVFDFVVKKAENSMELITVPLNDEENINKDEDGNYLITNKKKGATILIHKRGEGQKETEGLNDVAFELKNEDTNEIIEESITTSTIDGQDGMLKLENLLPGSYILKEIKPPAGYKPKTLRIVVTSKYDNLYVEYYEVVKDENGEYIELKAKTRKEKARMTTRSMVRSAGAFFSKKVETKKIPEKTMNVNSVIRMVSLKYHTALDEEDEDTNYNDLQIIKPHIGETVEIDIGISSEADLKAGEYFNVEIGNSLTPDGPAVLNPIELRDEQGRVVARSTFIKGLEGTGTNTYEFLMLEDTYAGIMKGKIHLFVDRSVELWNTYTSEDINGARRIPIFTNKNSNHSNYDLHYIDLKIDYGQFIRTDTTGYKEDAHFYITKVDKFNQIYEAEIYFTPGNWRTPEKDDPTGNINKNVEIIKGTLVLEGQQSNSLYNAMDANLDYISQIGINKTPTTTEFDFDKVWNKLNINHKPIAIKVRGRLGDIIKNGQIGIKVSDEYKSYDISHLLDLIKGENSFDTGSVKLRYVYYTEDGEEIELLSPRTPVVNKPIGESYDVRNYIFKEIKSGKIEGEFVYDYPIGITAGMITEGLTEVTLVYKKKVPKVIKGNVAAHYVFESTLIKKTELLFEGDGVVVPTKYDATKLRVEEITLEDGRELVLDRVDGDSEVGELTKTNPHKQITYIYRMKDIIKKTGNVTAFYILKDGELPLISPQRLFDEDVEIGTFYNATKLRKNIITLGNKKYHLVSHEGKEYGEITFENKYPTIFYKYELEKEPVDPIDPIDPVDPDHKPEEVDPLKPIEIEIVNYYNEKEFKKVDQDGVFLEGAVFKLLNPEGTFELAKSDENGRIVFKKLEPGEYTLTEASAPEGYILSSGILAKFEVLEDGTIKDIPIGEGNPIKDTFVNTAFEIPDTGIDAIVPFMGLGIIFLMASASLYLKKIKN